MPSPSRLVCNDLNGATGVMITTMLRKWHVSNGAYTRVELSHVPHDTSAHLDGWLLLDLRCKQKCLASVSLWKKQDHDNEWGQFNLNMLVETKASRRIITNKLR